VDRRDRGHHVGRAAGIDRPPTLAGAGRYLGFLPTGAGWFLGTDGGRRPDRVLFGRVAEIGTREGRLRSSRLPPQQTPRFPPVCAAAKFGWDFRVGGGGVRRKPPAADQPHASPERIPAGFLETGRPAASPPRVLLWPSAGHSTASRWKDTLAFFRGWGAAVGHPHGSFPRVARKPRPGASRESCVFEPPPATAARAAGGGPLCAPGSFLKKTTVPAPRARPRVFIRGVGQTGADFGRSREDHVWGTTRARPGNSQGFFGRPAAAPGLSFAVGRPIGKVEPVERREWPCSSV